MSVTFSQLGQLGRLGNQLWQIAACAGYSNKYNVPYIIPHWKYAQYFNWEFAQSEPIPQFQRYNEPNFHYNEIPEIPEIDLYGYFQSDLYFRHCEDIIKNMFQFKPEVLNHVKEVMKTAHGKPTVSCHIRKTDYLTMSHYYGNLDANWYKEAMSHFDDNYHFFVMSDDINWAKSNITFRDNVTFCSGNEIQDLAVGAKCRHNIIANSSFSYWQQYLNTNPDKKVIAPRKELWFLPAAKHSVEDLYQKHWITI